MKSHLVLAAIVSSVSLAQASLKFESKPLEVSKRGRLAEAPKPAKTSTTPAPAKAQPSAPSAPAKKPEVYSIENPKGQETTDDSAPSKPVKSKTSKKPSASSSESSTATPDGAHFGFYYTHLLPSPINLAAGSWVLGTTAAYGVTDFFQVSTDVTRLIFRHWNAQAKVPLVEYPTFIASAFINFSHFNYHHLDSANPSVARTSWQPGLVTGYEIDDDQVFFVGGNFDLTKDEVPANYREKSGYARGAQLEADWTWLYNPPTSRLADNAISAGATYDFTYKIVGVGVTHHWPTFQLGFHYYLNADHYKFLPIVNVTAGIQF